MPEEEDAMFVGRKEELARLEKMYAGEKMEMAVVYGRRRVGKTTLISEFCKNKRTVFFSCLQMSAAQNLEALSAAVARAGDGASEAVRTFVSFADAFTRMAELAARQRLVVVLDEYPYLAKAEPGISSLLQNFLDHQFKETKLFLILCGSSMSFMEKQVLGYQSPLYGRRTAQFKVEPFDYYETAAWFAGRSREEQAILYGITGGVPLYLEQFSPALSLRENLLENFFSRSAMLFEEPGNLLKQELREPERYNSIITAVAAGSTKLSEIAAAVRLETGVCSKYIDSLIELGILCRETPVTEPRSKRPVYQISDPFFRFWYTFVPRNMALIQSGRMEKVYDEVVGSRLHDYMGQVFERICRDWVLFHAEDLPFIPAAAGRWWGGDPKTKKQAEIDLVAPSADGTQVIVGSCKFRAAPLGPGDLALMAQYADAMGGGFSRRYYWFFSLGGFTDAFHQRAAADPESVRLLTLEDLYPRGN